MKVTKHPVLKAITDNSTAKTAITVDLSDDLIENSADFLHALYKLKTHYIPQPLGVWINKNQAYALAREIHRFVPKDQTVEDVADEMETFEGYRIWIRGRDA